MKNTFKTIALLTLLPLVLLGCGESNDDSATQETQAASAQTFEVSVNAIEIVRLSNGESVNVSTDGLSSDSLEYSGI